ncbi:MAG: transcriptional regulator [Cupriavidus sp.]|nr:transcriptional regulator [Cupriavidus sp.]
MRYTPPTPADLQRLKSELGRTGEQMADLFGVAGGQQWRKYTGGAQPREMAPQMLFFGAARIALSDEELERVLARMREIGAEIDIAPEAAVATEPGHPAQN